MAHESHRSDRTAAFRGLILGAIVLGAILFTIVKLTNAHYKSEAPASKPASTGAARLSIALDV